MPQMDTCRLTHLPGGKKLGQYYPHNPAERFACTTSAAFAASASGALERMPGEMPFPVLGVQTGNGSEFGDAFETFLKERGIRQQAIPPAPPAKRPRRTLPRHRQRRRAPGMADGPPRPEAEPGGGSLTSGIAAAAGPASPLGGRTPAAFLLKHCPEPPRRDPQPEMGRRIRNSGACRARGATGFPCPHRTGAPRSGNSGSSTADSRRPFPGRRSPPRSGHFACKCIELGRTILQSFGTC